MTRVHVVSTRRTRTQITVEEENRYANKLSFTCTQRYPSVYIDWLLPAGNSKDLDYLDHYSHFWNHSHTAHHLRQSGYHRRLPGCLRNSSIFHSVHWALHSAPVRRTALHHTLVQNLINVFTPQTSSWSQHQSAAAAWFMQTENFINCGTCCRYKCFGHKCFELASLQPEKCFIWYLQRKSLLGMQGQSTDKSYECSVTVRRQGDIQQTRPTGLHNSNFWVVRLILNWAPWRIGQLTSIVKPDNYASNSNESSDGWVEPALNSRPSSVTYWAVNGRRERKLTAHSTTSQ